MGFGHAQRAVRYRVATLSGSRQTGVASPSSLLTNLTGYWKLGEANGQRDDSHTNALHLTDNNTVTSGLGVDGVSTAAEFTRANSEYLSRADEAAHTVGSVSTYLAMWVRRASVGEFHMLFTKAAPEEYELRIDNSDALTFFAGGTSVSTLATTVVDTWYFIEAYHDIDTDLIGVALDGGAWRTQATANQTARTGAFNIGRRSDGHYLNGRMQGLGLWARVPTAGERTTLFNGGTAALLYPFA